MLTGGRWDNSRAFTLVEIMAVITIMGFIVGIAAPAYIRARENSRGQVCQENLVKIDQAKEMFAMDKNLSTGADITMADLLSGESARYLKAEPKCGSGGSYLCNPLGADPTCSIGTNGNMTDHIYPLQ